MLCLNCQKETNNPKFCCRSCAASLTNRMYPKRHKQTHQCLDCQCLIQRRSKRCRQCRQKNQLLDDITLQDAIYTKHHKSSAYALVRTRARAVAKKLNMHQCSNCGYDKHIEIAHKQAISTYPLDTKLSIINDPDNLLALCPNCHWEFDHT